MATLFAPPFNSHQNHPIFQFNSHKKCKKKIKQNPISHKIIVSSQSPSTTSLQNPKNSNPMNLLCKTQNLNHALSLIQQQITFNSCNNLFEVPEGIGLLIQSCGQQRNVEIGRKVHQIVSTHFSNDVFLNTLLITMYSCCGLVLDSRMVFDEFKMEKNLFIWNSMISAYTKNEMYDDVVLMFCRLVSETGLNPDNFTLPCVIKSCSLISNFAVGKTVHGLAVKLGLNFDVFAGNSLIMMYGKFELVSDAVKLFESLPERNLVSWNSMVRVLSENRFYEECFDVFVKMLEEDEECLVPDVATVVTLLPICAGERDVEMGMMIHSLVIKLGLSCEVTVNNALMDMYAKCKYSFAPHLLFGSNKNRNTVSWNSIIWNYSNNGEGLKAFDALREMQSEGGDTEVNAVTILNVLPALTKKSQLMRLKELHGYSIRHGFFSGELLSNAFIVAYEKCDAPNTAYAIFRGMETKSMNSWNAIIDCYVQYGDPRKAVDLYFEMVSFGLNPDPFCLNSLLIACSEIRLFSSGKEIHGFLLRNGLEKDPFISVSLLSFYFKCDRSDFAAPLFDRMENKSPVSWNAIVSGYSQNGCPVEALDVFRHMLMQGFTPSEIAVTSLLGACSQLSCLRLGKEVHGYILRANLTEDRFVSSATIDMYAKCGCLELSLRFFNRMTEKHLASWSAMISGYGFHGHGNEALELFEQVQRSGFQPDHFMFISILVACNHAGLVEDGLRCFNNMHSIYGVEPKLEHYACVVDMLGRAGRLQEALELVGNMPMKADMKIWSSLVSFCRIHDDLVIGKLAAERLMQLEPHRVENYVLVSNLLAQSGMWADVRTLRGEMKDKGLKKDAGCSWLEVGGKTYSFVVGDHKVSGSEEIREKWLELEKKIRTFGYIPDTSSVLHNLAEEEKLDILRGHSEKLAVSFGLLKTTGGVTLRICKNLRICNDCHNAIKLVSKVVDREIVVRDNKRFHHFRNGFCSCRDFW